MKYLTIEEVVAIHFEVIRRFGGSQGVRDFGLLHSAVERPRASFGGEDLYITLYDKAAALLHSIVMNHPFIDGNKRTGYVSVARFLLNNGQVLTQDKKKITKLILEIESKKLSILDISDWLQKNTRVFDNQEE